jgi:hypothetical protein
LLQRTLTHDNEPDIEYDSTLECDLVDKQTSGESLAQSCSYRSSNDADVNKTFPNTDATKKSETSASLDERILQETYSFMKSVQESPNRDEFTVFGQHIANRLRNITDAQAQLITQHQINNILFEAEAAKFQPSSVEYASGTTAVPSNASKSASP